MVSQLLIFFFFFFNDTATTEIYTLSLHDALPISRTGCHSGARRPGGPEADDPDPKPLSSPPSHLPGLPVERSEEHTSELQSRPHLVCRLLLEKKKKKQIIRQLLGIAARTNGKRLH